MSKKWSRAERLLALNLYFKLEFGQQHSGNKKVQKLAKKLGRSPGSINMKLNNYAAIDPTLDREGLQNHANVDEEVWDEYWNNLDRLATASQFVENTILQEENNDQPDQVLENYQETYGTETTTETTRRLGQQFFREVILSNYLEKCSVCELNQPELIDAAHITSWSDTESKNLRVNPQNGIALCKIHHAGFDRDHLNIHPDTKEVTLSDEIRNETSPGAENLFHPFENKKIFLPEKMGPDEALLRKKMG